MNPATLMKNTTEPGLKDATYEQLVREMLMRLGEDPEREGLVRTPARVEKAMEYMTQGYRETPQQILNDALFTVSYDEMVIVKDIEMFSMCEHHMLPFFGKASVGYVPDGKIIGLSKVGRVVDVFARRLQVQERLTNQIADALMEAVQPHGLGVVIEASHLCMMMRGVEKQNSRTITSALRGSFRDCPMTRDEFLRLTQR